MLGVSVFLLLALFTSCRSALSQCELSRSCSQCIGCGPQTSWCVSSKLKSNQPRCGTRTILLQRGCPSDEIVSMESLVNKTRDDKHSDDPKRRVEVSPQEVSVSVRVGEEVEIPLSYLKSGNYPVDIYVLSDLSLSMLTYVKKIAESAKAIALNMREKTSAFRMGFGSFVDKPVYPFGNLEKGGCGQISIKDIPCRTTIGYEHNVNITSDTELFMRTVNNITVAKNFDSPEGGLDAILQAAVCPEVIGWNPTAEKMILYITNGGLHIGGDGILVGIVKPAEEKCYMGKGPSGVVEYLKTKELDYPSVYQIKRVLDESNIGIVFATVKKDNQAIYSNLAQTLTKAKVATLPMPEGEEIQVSAIVKLIRENYENISSSVVLSTDNDNDNVTFKIETQCTEGGEWKSGSTKCDAIKIGEKVEYKVRINATACLKEPARLTFSTSEDQKLEVLVSTICQCTDCDTKFTEASSPKCNDKGDWVCGQCQCQSGRKGAFCECEESTSDESCRVGRAVCSNRGFCSCGKCYCSKQFSGGHCECDRQACPRASVDDEVCGGQSRGRCECDRKCRCHNGFVGDACECLNATECIKPGETRFCSGNGECSCGVCICNDGWELKHCDGQRSSKGESSPTCSIEGLAECVICHRKHTQTGKINADDKCNAVCEKNKDYEVIVEVKNVVEEPDSCLFEDEDNDCRVKAFTSLTEQAEIKRKTPLKVVISRQCGILYASAGSSSPLVFGVIGGVFLSGLIALAIWRIVAYFEDKNEYERLMIDEKKAMDGQQTNENPLYESPETVVYNPLHVDSPSDEMKLTD